MAEIFTKTGKYHIKHNIENQDWTFHLPGNRFDMLCLADGVSTCENGRRGAQIACEEAAYLLSGNEELFFQFSSFKISFLVLEHVVDKIKQEAQKYGNSPESYASTLLFCCIDKLLQKALLFNLGDGAAYCRLDKKCYFLLPPVSVSDTLCPQTMTRDAFKAALVKKETFKKGAGIFMCTDGLLHEMRNKDYGIRIKDAVREDDCKNLKKILESVSNMDDASFIAYDVE